MSKIIGNGLIAKGLKKNIISNNFVFFASGVSNSNEEKEDEFTREKDLFYDVIKHLEKNQKIIYFSTYSIHDEFLSNSAYKRHKLNMEELVKTQDNYSIIRLPNVVGFGGNSNTMINYFKNSVNSNKKITILKNAYRNILDIDDVVCFMNNLDDDCPNVIDLLHPISYKVSEILDKMIIKMDKNIEIKKIEGGVNYFKKPNDYVINILEKCNVNLTNDYLSITLNKYL